MQYGGIIRWPQAQYDMVRLGIGLYGIDSAVTGIKQRFAAYCQLKNKRCPGEKDKGRRNHQLQPQRQLVKNGKIATVRIGYADGYLRAFGNGVGKMLVKGQYWYQR
jgi:alanine racemase